MLGGEKAAVAFHGDHRPASVYIDGEAIYEHAESTKDGTMLTFDRTYNDRAEVSVFGESVQDGTPTPDNPVPIVSRTAACVETSNADGSKTSTTDLTSLLDGRELRSLPDGTRDEVYIRPDGSVVLVERVKEFELGDYSFSKYQRDIGPFFYVPPGSLAGALVKNTPEKNKNIVCEYGALSVTNTPKLCRLNMPDGTILEGDPTGKLLIESDNPTETIIGTIDPPETFYDTTHIWEANGADISAHVRVIPETTFKMLDDGGE